MSLPLSVLDLAPVGLGGHAGALADTLAVAREADRLGYHRLWVAEHHGMPSIASSSPPVLIAALAAATTRIRVGSGGVMLPNHSSLVVAEQFGTLVALYGDRIDLGLGRAPGTEPLVTAAIRRGASETVDDFANQVVELLAYFGVIDPLTGGQGGRIRAVPGAGDLPQLWLLGSSDFSARLAGRMGVPYAFAHHFAMGGGAEAAMELYRRAFEPSVVSAAPHAMVSVNTVVADDAAEARRRALPQALTMLRMRQGALLSRMPSVQEAEAHPWTAEERGWVEQRAARQAIGDREEARAAIAALGERTGANEVILAVSGAELAHRLDTLRLLAPEHLPAVPAAVTMPAGVDAAAVR